MGIKSGVSEFLPVTHTYENANKIPQQICMLICPMVTWVLRFYRNIPREYTNINCNERLWLKLWARGDCNCAILLRGVFYFIIITMAQLQSPRDHSFNPETRMKAVYICFIYVIHIFIVHWMFNWRKMAR